MDGLVSIIIPCYNSEEFIGDAINSVLAQTYVNWEMIIIDDCSSDNSLQIIEAYVQKDCRIRCLKTNTPSGSPAYPRNIGINNAQGRYIAFLDSDDIWLPTKLEEQLPILEEEHVAIVFSNYEKIAENGARTNRLILAPTKVNYHRLLLSNVIGCLTAIYDIKKCGKLYFTHNGHEDYIMWLTILKQGYWAYNTNTINALYRVRKRSVSSNKLLALVWQWHIYVRIEKTGYLRAVYYFSNYALRAFIKLLK